MLHALIRKALVQKLAQGSRSSIGHGMALGVTPQGQGGNQNIEDHEYDHDPGETLSNTDRKTLDQAGQPGITQLEPHHSRNTPEEAV